MNMPNKTIGICGFGETGSSAVSDLLKEFDENTVLDQCEFILPYCPDGLEDLSYHLHEGCLKFQSSVVAIERFKRLCKSNAIKGIKKATHNKFMYLTKKYIENITQEEWYSMSNVDYTLYPLLSNNRLFRKSCNYLLRIYDKIEGIINHEINAFPLHKTSFSVNPENYYEISKRYINEIIIFLGKEGNKNVILDQPFAGNNPQKSFKFFTNPVAIVVDRDPRDHYLWSRIFCRSKGMRFVPVDSVEKYVKFYRNLRKNMPYLEKRPDILNIRFEDMIYEYDKTIKKIMVFLDLKKHSQPQSIFNPTFSMSNTCLIDLYPEYAEDIKYIENELPEYLYPFKNDHNKKISNGKMFLGKSPLNRRMFR
jgi:hypothetical protein